MSNSDKLVVFEWGVLVHNHPTMEILKHTMVNAVMCRVVKSREPLVEILDTSFKYAIPERTDGIEFKAIINDSTFAIKSRLSLLDPTEENKEKEYDILLINLHQYKLEILSPFIDILRKNNSTRIVHGEFKNSFFMSRDEEDEKKLELRSIKEHMNELGFEHKDVKIKPQLEEINEWIKRN